MTYEEICDMVTEMGLPFAYHHFAEGRLPHSVGEMSSFSETEGDGR